MGLFDKLALATLPLVPRPLMRIVANRYIAGETREEALAKLAELQAEGFRGILDLLGEEIEGEAAAREVAASYCRSATALAERGLDAYVSIKPTHVGLRFSEELAAECFAKVAGHCAALDQVVRVEMEDRTTTDATLRIFERLRRDHDNVGIVLQSRLLRTPADIDALAPGPLSVRMVKGIYLEPPEVAHVDHAAISDAFVACSRKLLERGARVAFATHDGPLGERLLDLVRELGLDGERFGFEVLMGIQRHLWEEWRDAGHEVRVYVPYGPAWRAYSTRRLQKNPEIFRHVMRDLLAAVVMREGKVSRTALGVALWSSLLTKREGLEDVLPAGAGELTERLLAAGPRPFRRMLRIARWRWARSYLALQERLWNPGMLLHLGVRKRYVDDQVRAAIADGARRVVAIGAGFDTLGARLAREHPELACFELDHPGTQVEKARALGAVGETRPNLHLVPCDLAERTVEEALADHPAWSPAEPSVFVAEGLLMYLAEEVVERLLRFVAAAPGRRLVLSYLERGPDGVPIMARRGGAVLRWRLRRMGEPLHWCVPQGGLAELLEPLGLLLVEAPDAAELRSRYLAGRQETPLACWEHLAVVESVASS